MILWLKALHIFGVIAWFTGIFYLPRLFVYHAVATDQVSLERFVVMERRLYGMMSVGSALAIGFGIAMLVVQPAYLTLHWLQAKLVFVALLIGYHHYCRVLMRALAEGRNTRSQKWFRWFNEAPTVALLAILVLVVIKPF